MKYVVQRKQATAEGKKAALWHGAARVSNKVFKINKPFGCPILAAWPEARAAPSKFKRERTKKGD